MRPRRRPRRRAGCRQRAAMHSARRSACHYRAIGRMLHGEVGSEPDIQAGQPGDCCFERLSVSTHTRPRLVRANLLVAPARFEPLGGVVLLGREAGKARPGNESDPGQVALSSLEEVLTRSSSVRNRPSGTRARFAGRPSHTSACVSRWRPSMLAPPPRRPRPARATRTRGGREG
jgi:hypothetical protein